MTLSPDPLLGSETEIGPLLSGGGPTFVPRTLEAQKRHVDPGQYLILTLEGVHVDPTVKIEYPSGFSETLFFEDFERVLGAYPFLLPDLESRIWLIAFLSNYRRTAYYPLERVHKIRVTSPEDATKEIFV